ncbi:MAG TPA: Mur ligase family protein, partial [Candidatus Krumholzibacterium sp.]|nr:Mur ligase family protein [Candidatus Krumholzibacterium sp.]
MDIRTELAWIAGRLGSIGYRGVVGSDVRIAGVSIDSRTDCSGRIFVALEGQNHDGNDYVVQAIENGAAAAIVRSGTESGLLAAAGQVPLLGVQDTLKALQHIASSWLEKTGPKVVGITGSTGKTGTKELTASILGIKYRVHATEGNLNNEIGLPLTLLSMPEHTEVLVAEMGASHKKDIKLLASIARPEIGIITNIGPGHLEHFGSIRDVAAAKSELVEALGEGM